MPFTPLDSKEWFALTLNKQINALLENEFAGKVSDSAPLKWRSEHAHGKRVLEQLKFALKEADSEAKLIHRFELILKNNWRFVLSTSRSLSYTALANSQLTEIVCETAQYIASVRNKDLSKYSKPTSLIGLLMPSVVCTESLHTDYPSLQPHYDTKAKQWVDVDIAAVLRTHILSTDGLTLLPVSLLMLGGTDIDAQKILNPYFDYKVHAPEAAYLNEDESARLKAHSKLTRAYSEKKISYEITLNHPTHLLGQLRLLCFSLAYHSVEAVGSEYDAGYGVYNAILVFNNYYEQLGEQKDKIPGAVREEIEQLIRLSSDSIANPNATANYGTCVATRWKLLDSAMRDSEGVLLSISLSPSEKEAVLARARNEFELARDALKEALANTALYPQGKDKAGFTLTLLTEFNIDFLESDLNVIYQLNPRDIQAVLSRSNIKSAFLAQFKTIEAFVTYTESLSLDSLEAVLSATAAELANSLLKLPNDLVSLLFKLDKPRFKLICEAFQFVFPKIIPSVDALTKVLLPLKLISLSSCEIVVRTCFRAYEKKLEKFIKTASDFKYFMQYQSITDKKRIYGSMKNTLAKRCHCALDFKNILECLVVQDRKTMYEAVNTKLPAFISSFADYEYVNKYLDEVQQASLFTSMKVKLVELLLLQLPPIYKQSHPTTVQRVLKGFKEAEVKELFEGLRGRISSMGHFFAIYKSLEFDKKSGFYELLKNELSQFLKSAADLAVLFSNLSPLESGAVIALSDLSKETRASWNFSHLLPHLHYSQGNINVAYELMKDIVPQSGSQVFHILGFFNPETHPEIYANLKVRLPQVILSITEFNKMMQTLTSRQQEFIFDVMKEFIPAMIHSPIDLQYALIYLTKPQRVSFSKTPIVQNKFSPRVIEFQLALANGEATQLKAAFDEIARPVKTPETNFFKSQIQVSDTFKQLISQLTELKNDGQLKTLRNALSLPLTDNQLKTPGAIQKALLDYMKIQQQLECTALNGFV